MCASHLWLLLYSIRQSVSLDCGLHRPGAKVGEHVEAEFLLGKWSRGDFRLAVTPLAEKRYVCGQKQHVGARVTDCKPAFLLVLILNLKGTLIFKPNGM